MPGTQQRVCFAMHLKPDRVDDYLAAHEDVWPEMLDALRDAGWRNYSLFLLPESGLIVGYLETDDFDRATAAMEQTEVNARWQAQMAEFFQPARPCAGPPTPGVESDETNSGANPDTVRRRLTEYFHLS